MDVYLAFYRVKHCINTRRTNTLAQTLMPHACNQLEQYNHCICSRVFASSLHKFMLHNYSEQWASNVLQRKFHFLVQRIVSRETYCSLLQKAPLPPLPQRGWCPQDHYTMFLWSATFWQMSTRFVSIVVAILTLTGHNLLYNDIILILLNKTAWMNCTSKLSVYVL